MGEFRARVRVRPAQPESHSYRESIERRDVIECSVSNREAGDPFRIERCSEEAWYGARW